MGVKNLVTLSLSGINFFAPSSLYQKIRYYSIIQYLNIKVFLERQGTSTTFVSFWDIKKVNMQRHILQNHTICNNYLGGKLSGWKTIWVENYLGGILCS